MDNSYGCYVVLLGRFRLVFERMLGIVEFWATYDDSFSNHEVVEVFESNWSAISSKRRSAFSKNGAFTGQGLVLWATGAFAVIWLADLVAV